MPVYKYNKPKGETLEQGTQPTTAPQVLPTAPGVFVQLILCQKGKERETEFFKLHYKPNNCESNLLKLWNFP